MRFVILAFMFILAGCASVPTSGYISRVDHPYDRTFYAGIEKVVSSVMFVLKKQGWPDISEANPSVYERDDHYDNSDYQNLLIMTGVRKHFLSLHSVHLNVLIHCASNSCDLEIRSSVRNDRMIQSILDAMEQEISG